MGDIKENARKIWHFIWHEDSAASWIVNIILAFLIIKYIVYPVWGLIFGTAFPIVAVVSPSMEHDARFDAWWEANGRWYIENNITKEKFEDFSMKNGFNMGDIIFLKSPGEVEIGDIIVFRSHRQQPRPDPIIHRVVNKREDKRYTTKGDNNKDVIQNMCSSEGCTDETDIWHQQVFGKAYLRVPWLGWIKIIYSKIIGEPYCRLTNNFYPC